MNFTKRVALIALLIAACVASRAGAQVFPPSGGTTYTPASPLPAGAGGLGPQLYSTPPPGSTDFFEGDSITYGTGSSSCSGNTGILVPSPTGNCYADLVSIFDAASELNKGISGTCLEYTTTAGSVCNQSSTTTGSLINRYASDFTSLTAGMRFHLMIGTNDVIAVSGSSPDPLITKAQFQSNLITVLNAAAAIVGAANVYVAEAPFGFPESLTARDQFNLVISQVAEQYGYKLAPTGAAIPDCALANLSDATYCLYSATTVHPDVTGHAALAAAWESANYQTAINESGVNRALLTIDQIATGPVRPTTLSNTTQGVFSIPWIATATNDSCYGFNACKSVTSGSNNTAMGSGTLSNTTTALQSACFGSTSCGAVSTGGRVTSVGYNSCNTLTTGSNDSCFGYAVTPSSATSSNETMIGSQAAGSGSNTVTLGNTSVTKIVSTGYMVPTNGFSDTSSTCTGNSFCRAALVAGTYTWTFGHTWTNIPACIVTEESTTAAHTASGVPTTSTVVVTSLTTTGNTDYVDIMCGGRNG